MGRNESLYKDIGNTFVFSRPPLPLRALFFLMPLPIVPVALASSGSVTMGFNRSPSQARALEMSLQVTLNAFFRESGAERSEGRREVWGTFNLSSRKCPTLDSDHQSLYQKICIGGAFFESQYIL
jgi:hypothetical protein